MKVAEENRDRTETDNYLKEMKNNLFQVEYEAKGESQAVRDRITRVFSEVGSLQQLLKAGQPPLPATSESNHIGHLNNVTPPNTNDMLHASNNNDASVGLNEIYQCNRDTVCENSSTGNGTACNGICFGAQTYHSVDSELQLPTSDNKETKMRDCI
jgi:hypothetical protein